MTFRGCKDRSSGVTALGVLEAECMAAAEGLVQGPASSGAGLVVVMVTWSL